MSHVGEQFATHDAGYRARSREHTLLPIMAKMSSSAAEAQRKCGGSAATERPHNPLIYPPRRSTLPPPKSKHGGTEVRAGGGDVDHPPLCVFGAV